MFNMAYEDESQYDYGNNVAKCNHSISFEVSRDLIVPTRIAMRKAFMEFALSRGFACADLRISDEDALETFCYSHFSEWLEQKVGSRDTDWVLRRYYDHTNSIFHATIRFQRKVDAMLFKLTFDNQ